MALYAAVRNEVETSVILDDCLVRGVRVVYPKVIGPAWALAFHEVHAPSELAPGRFGIPEPTTGRAVALEDVDLVLVPGLVFDHLGGRLGFGRGCYDRAFAGAPSPIRVALAWGFQVLPPGETVPTEAHDVPMDAVVTETGVLATSARTSSPPAGRREPT